MESFSSFLPLNNYVVALIRSTRNYKNHHSSRPNRLMETLSSSDSKKWSFKAPVEKCLGSHTTRTAPQQSRVLYTSAIQLVLKNWIRVKTAAGCPAEEILITVDQITKEGGHNVLCSRVHRPKMKDILSAISGKLVSRAAQHTVHGVCIIAKWRTPEEVAQIL